LPGRKDAVARELALQKAKLRYLLTQAVRVKYSPELVFIYDEETQREIENSAALRQAAKELRNMEGDAKASLNAGLAEPEAPLPLEMQKRLEELRLASEKARGTARHRAKQALLKQADGAEPGAPLTRDQRAKQLESRFRQMLEQTKQQEQAIQSRTAPSSSVPKLPISKAERRRQLVESAAAPDDMHEEDDYEPKPEKKRLVKLRKTSTPALSENPKKTKQKIGKRKVKDEDAEPYPEPEPPRREEIDYSTLNNLFPKASNKFTPSASSTSSLDLPQARLASAPKKTTSTKASASSSTSSRKKKRSIDDGEFFD
jgi:hypothetical protein